MMVMDDYNKNVPNEVQNGSEHVQNGAEQKEEPLERVPNDLELVQNENKGRSEHVPNGSEQAQKSKDIPIRFVRNTPTAVPNGAENDQNSSELVPNNDREHSEGIGTSPMTVPNGAERFRTAPACSETHEGFTITIREAARIFEEAGVPRTERAITKWCNLNARGVARLACCYNEAERKYYITPESIERVTVEERKKFQYVEYRNGGVLSEGAEDLSEQLRNDREEGSEQVPNAGEPRQTERPREGTKGHTEGSAARAEQPDRRSSEHESLAEEEPMAADQREELKKLQMENYNLKVQLEGQKYLVMKFDELVAGERERHQQEKLALVDRLTDARHQIGTLEQKLLQLESPRGHVRDAETDEPAGRREAGQP
jgi:hypothetical protein